MSEAALQTSPGGDEAVPWLLYRAGGLACASPLTQIAEVVRVPALHPVPLAPAAMLGLVNRHGHAVAVLGLAALLDAAQQAPGPASRLLVLHAQRQAVLVDAVQGLALLPATAARPATAEEAAAGLAQVIPARPDQDERRVPDLVRLTRPAAAPARPPAPQPAMPSPQTETEGELLLVFRLGTQEYAMPVAAIEEIVPAPAQLLVTPHMQTHMLGMMTRRGRLLPVFDTRAALAAPQGAPARHVVVLRLRAGTDAPVEVGLLVETVSEVLDAGTAQAQPVPPLLAHTRRMNEIAAILKLAQGRRLVALLTPERLLDETALYGLEPAVSDLSDPTSATAGDEAQHVLVFQVGEAELAVAVAQVQEIIALPDTLTPAPLARPDVLGVLNLRGNALPVIDARTRLGLGGPAAAQRQRVVVVTGAGETPTGVLVDRVCDVVALPAGEDALPPLSAEQALLLRRVVLDAARMLLVVDARTLLHGAPELAEAVHG
ncbi:chemotaxis protein CheW [Chitiniphilus purpureus]|uniref:Chemotaxis protein CheW n=1 Tax=Chitiniphilus purpureus TaxID=2981137 RepID=A0ABY6DIH2_9NEIS|nr:chemotaxis protein CheW [Chitiniphilus sp. CD1]UXY14144.1 chemotaxis protein CheW [Chitiniphilus sp. CD1]